MSVVVSAFAKEFGERSERERESRTSLTTERIEIRA